MTDRDEDDLQMSLRMSLQGSPLEPKRSKSRDSVELSEETNRRVQRELMAATAEKWIRAAGDRIASPAKPRVQAVSRKVAVAATAAPSVSRAEEPKAMEEVVRVERVKLEKEGGDMELELGEELAPAVVDQLFSMMFGSNVSRDILAQWSNQGICMI